MIETILIEYLASLFNAYMEKPTSPQKKYIVIEKLGAGKKNQIKRASIAIQSYAESLYDAAQLNESVKEAMENIISLPEISGVELISDYNFTKPQTRQYRYQAEFEIFYY